MVINTGPHIVALASQILGIHVDYKEIRTPSLQAIFGIDHREECEVLEEFERIHPAHTLQAIDGALDAIRRLSRHCRIIFITSRPDSIQEGDALWDSLHLPDLAIPIFYAQSQRCPNRPSKVEHALTHNVVCHVDDMPLVLAQFTGSGIATLCHRAPYNDGISWDEIEQRLMAMIEQLY